MFVPALRPFSLCRADNIGVSSKTGLTSRLSLPAAVLQYPPIPPRPPPAPPPVSAPCIKGMRFYTVDCLASVKQMLGPGKHIRTVCASFYMCCSALSLCSRPTAGRSAASWTPASRR